MVAEFKTTYAISAYQHCCWELESRPGRGVQHYKIKFGDFKTWYEYYMKSLLHIQERIYSNVANLLTP
jgi:hypothetical protein